MVNFERIISKRDLVDLMVLGSLVSLIFIL